MPWNIFQVCVTKIREIWEMMLGLFAKNDKYCSLSRWHMATWVHWCLWQPGCHWQSFAGSCLCRQDLGAWQKSSSRKEEENPGGGKSPANLPLLLPTTHSTLSSFANHTGTSSGRDFTYSVLCLVSLIFIYWFLPRQRKSSNNSYDSLQVHGVRPRALCSAFTWDSSRRQRHLSSILEWMLHS